MNLCQKDLHAWIYPTHMAIFHDYPCNYVTGGITAIAYSYISGCKTRAGII